MQKFDDAQNDRGDFYPPKGVVQDSGRDGKNTIRVDPKGRHHHGVVDVILHVDDGHPASINEATAGGYEHEEHDDGVEGIANDDGQRSKKVEVLSNAVKNAMTSYLRSFCLTNAKYRMSEMIMPTNDNSP